MVMMLSPGRRGCCFQRSQLARPAPLQLPVSCTANTRTSRTSQTATATSVRISEYIHPCYNVIYPPLCQARARCLPLRASSSPTPTTRSPRTARPPPPCWTPTAAPPRPPHPSTARRSTGGSRVTGHARRCDVSRVTLD